MEDRLRECPCGHSAHIIFEDGTKVSDPWSITCKNFDCPWVFQTFPSREKAISAWNTRATDPLMEEMAKALGDLLFECDGVVGGTCAPKIETYNKAFRALQKYRETTCRQEKK